MDYSVKEKEVYDAIKSGFSAFHDLAKHSLKIRWKDLSRNKKYSAARALVYINGVAKQPEEYFARKNTIDAWLARAEEYRKENKIPKDSAKCAFYIVFRPMDCVCDNARAAFTQNFELSREFYNFCEKVECWEYERVSDKRLELAKDAGERIKKDSKDLCQIANVKNSNIFVRPFKYMVYAVAQKIR